MAWQHLRQKIQKAKKTHLCTGCLGVIYKGSFYRYVVAVDGAEFTASKMCQVCDSIPPADYDYEFTQGDLLEFHSELYPRTQIVSWTYKNPLWEDPNEYKKRYEWAKNDADV